MDQFTNYLIESIEELEHKERELIKNDCKDEANLIRIKKNVYGIAKSFYEVCGNSNFEEKIRKPAEAWQLSHDKAQAHDDIEKVVIEEIKLNALEEIIKKWKEQ